MFLNRMSYKLPCHCLPITPCCIMISLPEQATLQIEKRELFFFYVIVGWIKQQGGILVSSSVSCVAETFPQKNTTGNGSFFLLKEHTDLLEMDALDPLSSWRFQEAALNYW